MSMTEPTSRIPGESLLTTISKRLARIAVSDFNKSCEDPFYHLTQEDEENISRKFYDVLLADNIKKSEINPYR